MGNVRRYFFPDMGELDFSSLDELPFGAILVNEKAEILFYNRKEEDVASRRREDMLGKNFFELAPCAQVKSYYGRFLEVVKEPGFLVNFRFQYSLPGPTQEVEITMASFHYKGELLCLIVTMANE
jgi:photoactive yellow protein